MNKSARIIANGSFDRLTPDEESFIPKFRRVHLPYETEQIEEYVKEIDFVNETPLSHNQFIVVYSDITRAELLCDHYNGAKLYGDTESLRDRFLAAHLNHKYTHVFSFSIVDESMNELYLDSLREISRFNNPHTLPDETCSFIYINAESFRKALSDVKTSDLFTKILEYKSGGLIML